MKKILSAILLVSLFALSGCSGDDATNTNDGSAGTNDNNFIPPNDINDSSSSGTDMSV